MIEFINVCVLLEALWEMLKKKFDFDIWENPEIVVVIRFLLNRFLNSFMAKGKSKKSKKAKASKSKAVDFYPKDKPLRLEAFPLEKAQQLLLAL